MSYVRNGCVVLALLSLTRVPCSAQTLTGRVLEAGSGRPVAAALVRVAAADESFETESDSLGFFHLALPAPGRFGVRVERIGYAPAAVDTLSVGRSEIVAVTIRLSVTAVPLAPLLVIERRIDLRTEFERRLESGRRTGLGVFLTRAELESSNALSITAMLARVPLVSLSRGNLPVSLSGSASNHLGRPCPLTPYLDGTRMHFAPGESIDQRIQLSDLEGVEIYRNPTELPSNFAGIGQCGAVLFWTRPGEPGRRASWRYLVGAGAVVAMLVYFIGN